MLILSPYINMLLVVVLLSEVLPYRGGGLTGLRSHCATSTIKEATSRDLQSGRGEVVWYPSSSPPTPSLSFSSKAHSPGRGGQGYEFCFFIYWMILRVHTIYDYSRKNEIIGRDKNHSRCSLAYNTGCWAKMLMLLISSGKLPKTCHDALEI